MKAAKKMKAFRAYALLDYRGKLRRITRNYPEIQFDEGGGEVIPVEVRPLKKKAR